MKNISKKQWSRFCKDITQTYEFSNTEVIRVGPDGIETVVCSNTPLLEVGLARKRGKISDFEIKLGQIRNGSPVASSLMLGGPTQIAHETSEERGGEVIEILNEDDHRMIVRISGDPVSKAYNSFVEETAYFLAEARGFVPGHEQEDWFVAERLIREVALRSD
jgi:hypothetical protein